MNQKRKKLVFYIIAIIVILCVVALAITLIYTKTAEKNNKGKIYTNIYISKINVGGKSKSDAEGLLNSYVKKVNKDGKVILEVGEKSRKISANKLDINYNVEKAVNKAYNKGRTKNIFSRFIAAYKTKHNRINLRLHPAISEESAKSTIENNIKKLESKPINAYLKNKKGKVTIVKEVYGQQIEKNKATKALQKNIKSKCANGDYETRIKIPSKKEKPKCISKDLEGMTDVLGEYTTNYDSQEIDRCKNIKRGTNLINGTILKPKDKFSVYKAVAPFTAKNGYYLAGTITGDEVKPDYGGGICQVSTTLYNAVILSELKITERHNHSLAISYVDLSKDAAIAGTTYDLKFKNNKKDSIYIQGRAKKSSVTFTIYGKDNRPKDRKISFVSKVLSVQSPGRKVVGSDSSLSAGSERVESYGVTGYSAELWKVVKQKGKKTKEYKFNSSSYSTVPTKVVIGTKQAEKPKSKGKTNEKKEKKK